MELICPYCQLGRKNLALNHKTKKSTDISMKLVDDGNVLLGKHYDIEGDTFDAQDAVPINFCPMCGRAMHKE